jgi:hypothetical protein
MNLITTRGAAATAHTSARRLVRLAGFCAALGMMAAAPVARGADAPAKPPSPAQKPAPRGEQAKKAPAVEAAQRMSDTQLQLADRVHTGDAACEFNQSVNVERLADKPGHFKLTFKKVNYTVIPEETTSGALRLEDKKAGIVWLQIPSKSMLMNARMGQRLVDGCMHAEQRAAVKAVEAAAPATGGSKP